LRFIKLLAIKPGLFENLNIEFDPGINIVSGKNGSGKSFIARAMADSLWRNFCDKNFIQHEAWEDFYIETSASLSSKIFKFTSNSNKSFIIKSVTDNGREEDIFQAGAKEISRDKVFKPELLNVSSELFEFFSMIDCCTFENSSFIPSTSDMDNQKTLNYEFLKKILLYDASNYFNLSINLKKSFNREDNKHGKLLSEINKQELLLKNIRKKIEIIGIKNSRTQKLVREKNQLNDEKTSFTKSLSILTSQKEILLSILDNIEKIEALNTHLVKIKNEVIKEREIIKSVSDIEGEINSLLPQFSKIDEIAIENLDNIQTIFIEIRNINEKIDTIENDSKHREKWINRLSIAVNLTAAASIISILINSRTIFSNIKVIASILGFCAIFTPGMFLYNFKNSKKDKLEKLKKERSDLEIKLNSILISGKINMDNFDLNELYELLLKYFEDYVEYTDRLDELNSLKNSLKNKQYLAEIEDRLNKLKAEEDNYKKEISRNIRLLDSIKESDIEKNKIIELIKNIESQMEMITEQITFKENITAKVNEEMLSNPEDSREGTDLIEEQIKVEQIVEKLISNRNAVFFVTDIIDEAVKNRENKQIEKLVDISFEKFHFLTGNHYITRIDTDLILDMIRGKAVIETNPAILHALLMSIKFALTDFFIDDKISLPLIIDDPFQFMDEERTMKLKDQIIDISDRRQVIIFTHQKDKKDWGRYIEI
jgi:hypothetical protein